MVKPVKITILFEKVKNSPQGHTEKIQDKYITL